MKKHLILSAFVAFMLALLLSFGISALDMEKRTEYSSAGDVNGDGSINGRDSVLLLKALAGWNVTKNEWYSDVNGDGEVKGNDATFLLKYIADWDIQPTLHREYYNLLDFSDEIKNDGTVDICTYLTDCLAHHDNVLIPDGKYLLSNKIVLNDGQSVIGGQSTELLTNGKTVFYAAGKYIEETDEIDFAENILIANFKITPDTWTKNKTIELKGIANVTVDNISVEKAPIISVNTVKSGFNTLEGKEQFSKYQCYNYIIKNCYGIGYIDSRDSSIRGMLFYASRDFIVRDSKVEKYRSGIMWWGGGASINDNPPCKEEYIGKIANALFYNVTVDDVVGGGLWGTLGDNVTLKRCTIMHADDVGCDMEGCRNSIVTECYFEDCVYNFGAPDQFASNVTFSYNTSVQTADSGNLLHFDGHTSWDCDVAHDSETIYIEHNKFITYGKIGIVGATYFCRGPALGHLYLRDNEFVNTVFSSVSYPESVNWEDAEDKTYQLDLWETVIEDNSFKFDFTDGNPFIPDYLTDYYPAAINIKANTTTVGAPCIISVKNNTIEAVTGFSCGIWIEHGVTALDYAATCSGNIISSVFDTGIAIVNNTANKLTVTLENNIADSIMILGNNIETVEKDNINHDGQLISAE